MAMGKRRRQDQQQFWVAATDLPRTGGHVFYEKLNRVLGGHEFDTFVESRCAGFYADKMGRPSIPPGVYFRMLLIGFFEGIDSERGIAWRCADSLSLRRFLGYGLDEGTPDHSSISRTRRLMDLETHEQVFTFALKVLGENGLIDGQTIGVDATTLEANAAMRSIVRRDTGEGYQEYLEGLAKASGIETPTRDDLVRIDKTRKNKASNEDWEHPYDPDAKITKMKDGRTHLAHKAEHAVDMSGDGAIVAVTLQDANAGDTTTMGPTIVAATQQLRELADDPNTSDTIHKNWMGEMVADKGYHSNEVLLELEEMNIRSYVSEPNRGRRRWKSKSAAQSAVYKNRRRIRGRRGKRLMRDRGELIERSFAHNYDTGGMRRLHLKGRDNIMKRLLVHTAGFNLSLLMRRWIGHGKPRRLQGLFSVLFGVIERLLAACGGSRVPRDALTTSFDPARPLKLAA